MLKGTDVHYLVLKYDLECLISLTLLHVFITQLNGTDWF
jgi:hypothetical protein